MLAQCGVLVATGTNRRIKLKAVASGGGLRPIRLPTPSLIIGTDCDRRLLGPNRAANLPAHVRRGPLVLYPAIKLEIRVSRQNPLQCSPMHVETSRSFRFLIQLLPDREREVGTVRPLISTGYLALSLLCHL